MEISIMYKELFVGVCLMFLSGCGADSDLLRDQNVDTATPSNGVYEIVKNDMYIYKTVGDKVGFDYLTLNEECTKEECFLLQESYILTNGESQTIPIQKRIILSTNGWFDKSRHRECSLKFTNDTAIEYCPDGRKTTIAASSTSLEGQALTQIANAWVYADKIKDPRATFTYQSTQFNLVEADIEDIYEIVDENHTKCLTEDGGIASTDETLSLHTNVTCKLNGITFQINNLNSSSGTFSVDGTQYNTWKKSIINNYYTIVNLGETNGVSYFVAAYNGDIRIGSMLPKSRYIEHINTEAFNVIYTQLKDEYKK